MGFSPQWSEVWEKRGLIASPIDPAPPLDCSEKDFQARVVALAKKCGWMTHHHFDSRRSSAGWPDLVLCKPPALLFVELKIEGQKPKAAQLVWLTALRACGADARTWWPSSWSEIVATLKSVGDDKS